MGQLGILGLTYICTQIPRNERGNWALLEITSSELGILGIPYRETQKTRKLPKEERKKILCAVPDESHMEKMNEKTI